MVPPFSRVRAYMSSGRTLDPKSVSFTRSAETRMFCGLMSPWDIPSDGGGRTLEDLLEDAEQLRRSSRRSPRRLWSSIWASVTDGKYSISIAYHSRSGGTRPIQ